ncbi:hypothetical protein [Aquipseudomonas campi]
MPNKQQISIGERKIMEARITRLLRIALVAALVIALVIPVAESAFIISSSGKLVMRSIDAAALLAIFLSLGNAFLLDRRLNSYHMRLMDQLRAEAKDQRR